MTAPVHYQVTTITLSWILESHAQKIGQNYVIVLTKFRHESTTLSDVIFFYHILASRKATK